jgi:23S rRNA (uridine2552-2'-O)-methyltransferase
VKQAVAAGYRSRAAYKLIELDQREKLLRPGQFVLDLGCAPGGWSQVAAARVRPGGDVLAVDLLEMADLEGVRFLHGDFLDPGVRARIVNELPVSGADLVISDMAPNLSGVKITDQAACEALVVDVLDLAAEVLKPGANVLVKVFQGAALEPVLAYARAHFERVRIRKPSASRAHSAESYLLAAARGGILSK